jgi:hypothetical protein
MSRLFTIGCSHTLYPWPTYADILSKSFDEYYNYALPGIGNHAILIRLQQLIKKHKPTIDDTLIIQWTTPHRFDFYKEPHGWYAGGNLAHQFDDVQQTIIKWCWDDVSWEKVSDYHIDIGQSLVDNLDCNVYITSYDVIKDNWLPPIKNLDNSKHKKLKFLGADPRRKHVLIEDHHYTPEMHLEYLEKYTSFEVTNTMIDFANSAQTILEEIKDSREILGIMMDHNYVGAGIVDLD